MTTYAYELIDELAIRYGDEITWDTSGGAGASPSKMAKTI